MNKPFQFYLDDRQRSALDRLSQRLGKPRAELVRMGIDRVIQDLTPPDEDPAWKLIGLADTPDLPADLAERHDHYLAGDFEDTNAP